MGWSSKWGARCSLGHHRGLLRLGRGCVGDRGTTAGRALVATFPTFVGSCLSRQKCWWIQRSPLKHREGCGNSKCQKSWEIEDSSVQDVIGRQYSDVKWPQKAVHRESSFISGKSRLVKYIYICIWKSCSSPRTDRLFLMFFSPYVVCASFSTFPGWMKLLTALWCFQWTVQWAACGRNSQWRVVNLTWNWTL